MNEKRSKQTKQQRRRAGTQLLPSGRTRPTAVVATARTCPPLLEAHTRRQACSTETCVTWRGTHAARPARPLRATAIHLGPRLSTVHPSGTSGDPCVAQTRCSARNGFWGTGSGALGRPVTPCHVDASARCGAHTCSFSTRDRGANKSRQKAPRLPGRRPRAGPPSEGQSAGLLSRTPSHPTST